MSTPMLLQGPPTEAASIAHLHRLRGRYVTQTYRSGYEYYDESVWDWASGGNLLTSSLPGDMHAPVLDVDKPVTVTPIWDGSGSRITVTARGLLIARTARSLTRQGWVPDDAVSTMRALVRAGLRHPIRSVEVTFDVALPVRATPSNTEGHHHLLVDHAMSWKQTKRLVRALEGTIVDSSWASANLRNPRIGLVINSPLPRRKVGA